MFFYIASSLVLHYFPLPFQTPHQSPCIRAGFMFIMLFMPGTVAWGKWIRGAVSTSNMFLTNIFSFFWYLKSENLLLEVLFSSPNQPFLSFKHYLLKSIFPVSGMQTPVSCLTLIPSFLKPKKSLMSYGFMSRSPHLSLWLQVPLSSSYFLRLYSHFSPFLPLPCYQSLFFIEQTDDNRWSKPLMFLNWFKVSLSWRVKAQSITHKNFHVLHDISELLFSSY